MAFLGGVKLSTDNNLDFIKRSEPVQYGLKEYLEFTPEKYYTIGDNDPQEAYTQKSKDDLRNTIHWGQLKLLLTVLQFITLYWDPDKIKDAKIVYVGAGGTGTNIAFLHKMFPTLEWHLYDTEVFHKKLYNNPKIHLYQRYFTMEDAQNISGRNDIFFISDIRNLDYTRGIDYTNTVSGIELAKQTESYIWNDMLLQQEWVKIIKPVRAQLKFRLPYAFDFIEAQGNTRPYLDGLVYMQAWRPQTSTEARLVPNPDLVMRDWDYKTYQHMCFYNNKYTRNKFIFENPINKTKAPIAEYLGLYNDLDSCMTVSIIMDYLVKMGRDLTNEAIIGTFKLIDENADDGTNNLLALRSGFRKTLPSDKDEE